MTPFAVDPLQRVLDIAAGIPVPIDFVTARVSLVGTSGAGKSNALARMVEQIYRVGGLFTLLDPLGANWGLRWSADGSGIGLPVPIFGGYHGNVPILPTHGPRLARTLYAADASAIVDLSAFLDADKNVFCTGFLNEMFALHSRAKKARAILADEAHLIAPENPANSEEFASRAAMHRLHTGGRGIGLGLQTATQSSADQAKKTMKQSELFIALRTFAPLDQKPILDYMKTAGPDRVKEVQRSLASLKNGEAWFLSPAWLDVVEKHRFRLRETFDSSRTPEVGEEQIVPREIAPLEIERLREIFSEQTDEASDDPADLQERIKDLERKLAARAERATVTLVDRPVLREGEADRLAALAAELRAAAEPLAASALALAHAVAALPRSPAAASEAPSVPEPATARAPELPAPPAAAPPKRATVPSPPPPREPAPPPGGPPMKILGVLAGAGGRLSPFALGLRAGYSHAGGSFQRYLSSLRSAGYVRTDSGDVAITPDGAAAAEPRATTSEETVAIWRAKQAGPPGKLFDAVLAAHPGGLTREELGRATSYAHDGGSFNRYLSTLTGSGLVARRRQDDGSILFVAADELYPTGPLALAAA